MPLSASPSWPLQESPWRVLALSTLTLTLACASRPGVSAGSEERPVSSSACDPERDRAAILQMAGNYRVGFAFDETVGLSEGYTLHEPYRAKATEWVEVLEDTPRRISLQHVLVTERDGKRSTLKHWRQDWTFEDTTLLEFRGHRTWERRVLAPHEVTCTWSQAVYEVDDGPRYEGYGRWTHAHGVSAWQSEESWRPLPRREYTKRSDYDVLVTTNRHALTPTGWVHEQDSLKVVLGPNPHALAREHGLNVYTRQPADAASTEASTAWKQTQGFWSEVRDEWRTLFQSHPRFTLRDSVEGKPRYEHLFELEETTAPERRERIRATLESFLETAVSTSTAPAGE
ncbi:hypothetical protein JRI60_20530 [Archangium violaceum]|uniref:DUF6607 family protein n=1 Tax=Archangium violaceum TaxID=83451 RepID=UPI001952813C|nr:DUF6607 family protein [Archangium violaceum]QRO01242.1 hypothetical protein JRI60_20530 [Archangium violaceum]